MKFENGNKAAKGGRRNPPGGRPTKAALEAQEARLTVWQKELEKNELMLAKRYIKRAMKSDRILIDARKAIVPDAKRTIEIETGGLLEAAVRRLRERKNGEGNSR
jgi:hypothetical protein